MIERIIKRPESSRFLGDEADMISHDLNNEDKTEQEFYIDEVIEKENAILFYPDTFEEVPGKDMIIANAVSRKEYVVLAPNCS